MKRPAILLSAIGVALSTLAGAAKACGVDSDCVIEVADQGARTYRVYLPDDAPSPAGAIFYAHGYRGSAAGAMRNGALLDMADRLGVALVALNADGTDDWVLPGAPKDPGYRGRRELDYVAAVVADVEDRFGIGREDRMLGGFSAGGMLTWNVICHASDLFPAYAPVAGVYWEPVPESCAEPVVSVIHVHGLSDEIVPIEGRPIGRARQADVRRAIALYATFGGFGAPEPAEWTGLSCARQSTETGAVLELCLHGGGHSFRPRYLSNAWRRFTALGVL